VLAALLVASLLDTTIVTDSIVVQLSPNNNTATQIKWVSFSADGSVSLSNGTGPESVSQAANGIGITYCAKEIGTWLRIVATSTTGIELTATGPCTTITARARGGIATSGTADPRVRPRGQ
jgi:hypothetical protein